MSNEIGTCRTPISTINAWTPKFSSTSTAQTSRIEAKTVVERFVNQFVCRFGAPDNLHTDQGRNFESALRKCVNSWAL